ncbi:unnamed protein product [Arctogadus glacialis]
MEDEGEVEGEREVEGEVEGEREVECEWESDVEKEGKMLEESEMEVELVEEGERKAGVRGRWRVRGPVRVEINTATAMYTADQRNGSASSSSVRRRICGLIPKVVYSHTSKSDGSRNRSPRRESPARPGKDGTPYPIQGNRAPTSYLIALHGNDKEDREPLPTSKAPGERHNLPSGEEEPKARDR